MARLLAISGCLLAACGTGGGAPDAGPADSGPGPCAADPCEVAGTWAVHLPAGESCVPPAGFTLVVAADGGAFEASMTPASPFCGVTQVTAGASRGDAGECLLTARRSSSCTYSGEAQCEDVELTLAACADGTAAGTLQYRRCWCGGTVWPPLSTMSVTAERR